MIRPLQSLRRLPVSLRVKDGVSAGTPGALPPRRHTRHHLPLLSHTLDMLYIYLYVVSFLLKNVNSRKSGTCLGLFM